MFINFYLHFSLELVKHYVLEQSQIEQMHALFVLLDQNWFKSTSVKVLVWSENFLKWLEVRKHV